MKNFLGIAVFSLAITGCASSTSVNGPSSTIGMEPTESTMAPSETNAFVYPLVGGGTVDLSRGANAEPVALWFWAPG